MKFGINLAFMRAERRADVARHAEAAGFESVWMPDHLVLPIAIDSHYPYSPTGEAPLPPHVPLMDPLASIAFMAGSTSRINFGIAVYILPLREFFVTARNVLTLDTLSGGRLLFGAGVGWMREEYELAGRDWRNRGRIMDEYVRALRVLWTQEEPEFHGEFLDFARLYFDPKPARPGGPPIIIGGESAPAMRRAAVLGDGWIGLGATPEEARAHVERLTELRRRAGRESEPFEVTLGGRVTTLDDVRAYADAGVHRLIVNPWMHPREAISTIEEFGDRIISRLSAGGPRDE
ncbi:MAG: TIGR03619 family F420-dependent LLM class oxidoreductase [Dehalococcoidia bacterium]